MDDRKIEKDCIGLMKMPIVMMFFSTFLMIAFPSVSAYIIGSMADSLMSFDKASIIKKLPSLIISILFTVVVAPLSGLLENYLLVKKGYQYDAFLFGKYLKKNLREIEERGTGAVSEIFADTSGMWCYMICELVSYPLVLIAYLLFIFFLLARSGSSIPFIAIVVSLPVLYIIRNLVLGSYVGKSKRIKQEYAASRRDIESFVVPSSLWLSSWKMNGLFQKLFSRNMEQWMDKKLSWCNKVESVHESSLTFLDVFIPIAVLFSGVFFVANGFITLGELLAGWLLLESVKACYSEISHWVYAVRSIREIRKKIEIFYGEVDDENQLDENISEIEVNDISFSYGKHQVLDSISLRWKKGKTIKLEGENGSGKSTFIKILSGLYRPECGQITSDTGKELSLMDLRRVVTLSEQNSHIFSGTVFDNLFAEDKDSALKILSMFGFEKSFDYEVGRDGKGLSSGEKKKIILTRAMLRDTPFLILDEPLNHFDSKASAAVKDLVSSSNQGIIIISHKDLGIDYCKYVKVVKH